MDSIQKTFFKFAGIKTARMNVDPDKEPDMRVPSIPKGNEKLPMGFIANVTPAVAVSVIGIGMAIYWLIRHKK
uniref:Uncharacterized protein n=1 Tax=Panagrolaimus davidi TaxID=227884 RepID=A0A914QXF3_9BILA